MATITKRNNTYKITVSCGYDINGKQIRRHTTWVPEPGMTAKQEAKELERQKVLFEEKCRTGQVLDGGIRFAEFAERWFADYAEKQLRPTTLRSYHQITNRINAAIGHIRLDKLQPHHIISMYNNLSEVGVRATTSSMHTRSDGLKSIVKQTGMSLEAFAKSAGISDTTLRGACNGKNVAADCAQKISDALEMPLAELFVSTHEQRPLDPASVRKHHAVLSSILATAVKWQVIPSNPCERVQPPKLERKESVYLDEQQAVQLLDLLSEQGIQHRTIVTLLLFTGLRRGELCGLEWADVDFAQGLLDVQRSSLYLPGKGIFADETKNHTSSRVIKLPPDALLILRQYRARQQERRLQVGDQWQDNGRLFTTWDGSPIHPDTFSKWFSGFVKKHGVPPITAHSLRHTNATLLIAAGVNVKTVSSHLGHATIATTGNIYAHAIKSAEAAAAEALQNVLSSTKKKHTRV